MPQPWKTSKWFVSPWCYLPEVQKDSNSPRKIKIHDVTLRDGNSRPVSYSGGKRRWRSPSA